MLINIKNALVLIVVILLLACGEQSEMQSQLPAMHEDSPVEDDVLFLVLGKMSLYDQDVRGELVLRNHHFVAEIMPKEGRKIIAGTLSSEMDPEKILTFNAEGNAFLAHGERAMNPAELHALHPDGAYLFDYETESGRISNHRLLLKKRPAIDQMPAAARVRLRQKGMEIISDSIDPDEDLLLSWESMPGNTKAEKSELPDLIFVLGFDCFGKNIAHSGRPFQGGKYLSYRDTEYVIAASSLNAGTNYTAIVEQATADTTIYRGVPGISTYATLTFVNFQTTGTAEAGQTCPASAVSR